MSNRTSVRATQRGTTLVELLVALAVFGMIVLGMLPVMHRASMSDRGARNTTNSSFVATRIMEVLKLYRQIQLDDGAIPAEFGDFIPDTPDPYRVDGTGIWETLGFEPDDFEMTYTLTNDPTTTRLLALVTVRTRDPLGNLGGGGQKWVEFASAIE